MFFDIQGPLNGDGLGHLSQLYVCVSRLFSHGVATAISDDCSQPGLKGSTGVVLGQKPHHAKQGLLAGVLGLFSVTGFKISPPSDRGPPLPSEGLQRVSIPSHRLLEKLLLEIVGGHVRHHHTALLRVVQKRLVFS